MADTLVVSVEGTPRPQGSIQVRAYQKDGRAILGSTTKGLKEWRTRIADELRNAAQQQNFAFPLTGAVRVEMHFYVNRPKSVTRELPTVRPDLDKLVRATLDAITESGIFGDDAQVCELHATKRYTSAFTEGEGVYLLLRETSSGNFN